MGRGGLTTGPVFLAISSSNSISLSISLSSERMSGSSVRSHNLMELSWEPETTVSPSWLTAKVQTSP